MIFDYEPMINTLSYSSNSTNVSLRFWRNNGCPSIVVASSIQSQATASRGFDVAAHLGWTGNISKSFMIFNFYDLVILKRCSFFNP